MISIPRSRGVILLLPSLTVTKVIVSVLITRNSLFRNDKLLIFSLTIYRYINNVDHLPLTGKW